MRDANDDNDPNQLYETEIIHETIYVNFAPLLKKPSSLLQKVEAFHAMYWFVIIKLNH